MKIKIPVLICYGLACISIITGILFFAKAHAIRGQLSQQQAIEKILLEADEIHHRLGSKGPADRGEVLLAQILSEIRGIPPLIYFVAGILLAGQFLTIGLLWSRR